MSCDENEESIRWFIFFVSYECINKMTDDGTILRTRNYYHPRIDPQHYYKTSDGSQLDGKSIRAEEFKNVYLSDLVDNEKCSVSFSVYRDTDDKTAAVKISQDSKNGIVRSYNPETNLLAVDSIKKHPSRLSTMFNKTNKMRYVEPSTITVSSISRFCLLRRVPELKEGGKRNKRNTRNSRNKINSRNTRNNRNNRNKRNTRNTRKRR